jgi:UDP:flavonoid glycosyltransferase YjiC (YdhE family)
MNKEDLFGAIQKVLGNPSYRDTARRFQRTIARTHGLDRAAAVLERAFQLVDESGVAVWEKPLDTDAHSPT